MFKHSTDHCINQQCSVELTNACRFPRQSAAVVSALPSSGKKKGLQLYRVRERLFEHLHACYPLFCLFVILHSCDTCINPGFRHPFGEDCINRSTTCKKSSTRGRTTQTRQLCRFCGILSTFFGVGNGLVLRGEELTNSFLLRCWVVLIEGLQQSHQQVVKYHADSLSTQISFEHRSMTESH